LVAAFCKAVGLEEKPTRHELLKHVADARGDDASWVNDLRVARDHFLHRATGYLAIDWAAQDLLLLTRDVSKFEDPTTCIRYSRLRAIRDGFELSKEPLQVYLMRLLMPEADQGVIDVFREMAGYTVGN
jgi:hypothetical protein